MTRYWILIKKKQVVFGKEREKYKNDSLLTMALSYLEEARIEPGMKKNYDNFVKVIRPK